jgi:glutaminyl-peptide cyclotransferase
LARVGKQLVQLTWREGAALVYDLRRFRQSETRSFTGEGWGLCFDGSRLIMSDGSDVLTVRDPATMAVWRRVPVTLAGKPVRFLNELEFADGSVYANVWQSTEIVRIEPRTGRVIAVIDASVLLSMLNGPPKDVLNGIAYAPDRGTFFLTGKYWPQVFEVQFQ